MGESIAHYQIESLIGIGGMGEVYLARDERLGRKVALKFLPQGLTANNTQLSRFKSEARAASALNHPNILTVYEIGTEGNRHFIATEFIEGVTLRAALARGRMSVHDALEVAVQVASALAAAHRHRCGASRHQTGKHHDQTGWLREGPRFWACETHRTEIGVR